MNKKSIRLPQEEIDRFCRRWRVAEMSVFGSAEREDFGPESDVDILVTFALDAGVGLFDMAQMQIELEGLLGRPVDLVEKAGLQNPFRRTEILKTSRVIYASERT